MSHAKRNRNRARKNRAGISTAFSAITIESLGVIFFLLVLSAIRQNHSNVFNQADQAEAAMPTRDSGFELAFEQSPYPSQNRSAEVTAGWLGISNLRDSN